MNKRLLLIPLAMGLASTPLFADDYNHRGAFQDRARVVDVSPIYERVEVPTERQECWTEEVHDTRPGNSSAGMVAGGIIGGVLGNQLGKGDGRRLAAVAGTVIGAAVGHDIAGRTRGEPYSTSEHHCQLRTDYVREERLRAYQVTYRYHGETFVTEMDHDPGRFVPIRVEVSLME